jgi:hypothetical protein
MPIYGYRLPLLSQTTSPNRTVSVQVGGITGLGVVQKPSTPGSPPGLQSPTNVDDRSNVRRLEGVTAFNVSGASQVSEFRTISNFGTFLQSLMAEDEDTTLGVKFCKIELELLKFQSAKGFKFNPVLIVGEDGININPTEFSAVNLQEDIDSAITGEFAKEVLPMVKSERDIANATSLATCNHRAVLLLDVKKLVRQYIKALNRAEAQQTNMPELTLAGYVDCETNDAIDVSCEFCVEIGITKISRPPSDFLV